MENQIPQQLDTESKTYTDTSAIRARLQTIKHETEELLKLFAQPITLPPISSTFLSFPLSPEELSAPQIARTLEGIFNGEKMIGTDNQEYHVPPNYASKSKLVAGDRMKLTITPTGSFIYKQIGPIERQRVIGALCFETDHNRWLVKTENKEYRVLTASISFYKGKPGDEVILLAPQGGTSEWATVDHLIAK